jgi:hypothetical protein
LMSASIDEKLHEKIPVNLKHYYKFLQHMFPE